MRANNEVKEDALQLIDGREDDGASKGMDIDVLELMYHLIDKLPQIIIVGVICAMLVGGWVFLVETPTYQATSKLYVVNATNSLVNLQDLQLGNSLASDYMQIFSNVEVHEYVREKLHLNYTDEELDGMVSVSNPSNTRILVITVTSKNQYEALKMAEAYAEEAQLFIEERMDSHMPSLFEKPTMRDVPRQRAQRVIIAFLIGALAVTAVYTVMFIVDDRITTSEFVEKRTGIVTLGMMPILAQDETEAAVGSPKKKRK